MSYVPCSPFELETVAELKSLDSLAIRPHNAKYGPRGPASGRCTIEVMSRSGERLQPC